MQRRNYYEELASEAVLHGCRLLSPSYLGSKVPLRWGCAEGHTWYATPDRMKNTKSWCPTCRSSPTGNLSLLSALVNKKRGRLVSETYLGTQYKLEWECANGHRWFATPSVIKAGSWCPECNLERQRLTIKEMDDIAEARGGSCLSREYKNLNTKLQWECANGHRWWAKPGNVKFLNRWCPLCGGSSKKSIDDARELARSRGGKCLSRKYINGKTKLYWECSVGHKWYATYEHVRFGTWCPYCAFGKSEGICRYIFERIFEKPFPKKRPRFLLMDSGQCLELDGFNEELKLAFEYNGEQHYMATGKFSGKIDLERRKHFDNEKNRLCKLNNIILINIPYTVYDRALVSFILDSLQDHKRLLKHIKRTFVSLDEYTYFDSDGYRTCQRIAKERGGSLLSKTFVRWQYPLKWQCEKLHIWEATPTQIKRGSWCPHCAGNILGTIEEMHKLALNKGGKCLSSEYVNSSTKLSWECSRGHRWFATGNSVKRGSWCSKCLLRNITIEEIKAIAVSKEGKCVSELYTNTQNPLLWECRYGHTWSAPFASIDKGSWCPKCAGRLNEAERLLKLQQLAKAKGGKCLSTRIKSMHEKTEWQCKNLHTWRARASHIQDGSWCPVCARMRFGEKLNTIREIT